MIPRTALPRASLAHAYSCCSLLVDMGEATTDTHIIGANLFNLVSFTLFELSAKRLCLNQKEDSAPQWSWVSYQA